MWHLIGVHGSTQFKIDNIVELVNHIIQEIIVVMMYQSRFTDGFWDNALLTTMYPINK